MANSMWNPRVRAKKLRRLVNLLIFLWIIQMILLIALIKKD